MLRLELRDYLRAQFNNSNKARISAKGKVSFLPIESELSRTIRFYSH
jgi:hypothetical protein